MVNRELCAGLFPNRDSRLTVVPASPYELFRRLTSGVYVVTATDARFSDGFAAAWVTQVSFDPLLIAISINPRNATWSLIQGSGGFVINVLKGGQLELARHFGTTSGRTVDKLATVRTHRTGNGGIVLTDSAAWLECRVTQQLPAGDHVVVIAQVVGGDVIDGQARPLAYSDTREMDGAAALFPPAL